MAELRVGDRVELVGEITRIGGESDGILLRFGGQERWLFAEIVRAGKLQMRPLAVGDKVTWGTKTANYFIEAIYVSKAWLRPESRPGTWMTMDLADLERA